MTDTPPADEPVPKQEISEQDADRAAAAVASIEELKMLDNGALSKIENIEKQIMYRSFYFPGGKVRRLHSGLGTDDANNKYDQIPGERDLFARWDPRYLDDYVTQAKQKGYHRHFLYYNGKTILPISFDEAKIKLQSCLTSDGLDKSISACDEYDIYGILNGLLYMGKAESFLAEQDNARDLQLSVSKIRNMLNLKATSINKAANNALNMLIGQSSSEFINDDVGWSAELQKYAFDIVEYAAEWDSLQADYKKYKEQIWEILKNTNTLNLCTNVTKGIISGDVNINQEMDCAVRIGDVAKDTKNNKETTKDGTHEKSNKEIQDEKDAEQEAKMKAFQEQQEAQMKAFQQQQEEQARKMREEQAKKDAESKKNTTIIIVVIIIFGLIIAGVGGFMYMKSLKNNENVIVEYVD